MHIITLFLAQLSKLGSERSEMEFGNFFIEMLRKHVHLTGFISGLRVVDGDLSQHLIGEGVRHHETWVSGGTSEVQQSSVGEHDDSVSIWEDPSISLRLDFNSLDSWVGFKSSHVKFVIEVTDVSNDSVVLHLLHMLHGNNTLVSGSGDEDIDFFNNRFDLLNLETFHASLKGADWIDFRDVDN